MRRLKFQFIADSRFNKKIYHKIVKMDEELKESLKNLPVELDSTKIQRWYWPKSCGEVGHQCRKTYYLQKLNRSITWNNIYRIINKIYAPYYSFIK